MNKIPTVSVIITTYNRADLLPRAINSVLNQTYKDFELIIVDDGSTDNTKEIVEDFQQKDSRIVYVYQENQGWPSALNKGLSVVRGEFIAFLDSDDEWLPLKLEEQINIFNKSNSTNLGMVGCDILIIKENTNFKKEFKFSALKENLIENVLKGRLPTTLSALLIRREIFNKIGLIDKNLRRMADQDLWIRILQYYNVDFVPSILLKYYIHGGNISISQFPYENQVSENLYLIKKHENFFKKYPQSYSHRLKTIGTLYMVCGDSSKARIYFLKAIKVYPMDFFIYRNFLLSFLGKNIYSFLLKLKKRMFDISF